MNYCNAPMDKAGRLLCGFKEGHDGGHIWESKESEITCDRVGHLYECARCKNRQPMDTVGEVYKSQTEEIWEILKKSDRIQGRTGDPV